VKRLRSSRGMTIVEVAVSATILIAILAGTNAMMDTSSGVAQSTTNQGNASARADRALQLLASAIRKGSLATLQKLDGSTFSDGQNDVGFKIQEDTGYNGSAILGPITTYQFVLPVGATEGSITQTQNGVGRVLVNGVTAFTVTRAGDLLTLDVQTESGPADDRLRTVHGVVQVTTRNP
jgi:hypothetical protein